jgi:hypothetical protein
VKAADTGARRAPTPPHDPGVPVSDSVQPGGTRVREGMDDLMETRDDLRAGAGADDPLTAAPGSPGVGGLGADAVPLRPISERDADLEGAERLRLVAAGSRRRKSMRRILRLSVPAMIVLGLGVLVAMQFGDGKEEVAPPNTTSNARASTTASAARSLHPSPALAHAVSGRRRRADRSRHVDARQPRRRPRPHRGERSQRAGATRAVGEPVPEPQPETRPEVTSEPDTGVVATALPEPEPAPPTPAPVSASRPESNATEQSEVEAQFGFEK